MQLVGVAPRLMGGALFVLLLSACAPTAAEVVVATATLVPPTSTPEVTLPAPTPTRSDLLNPSDIVFVSTPEPLTPLLESDPINVADIAQLQAQLATILNINESMIQWLNASASTWRFRSTRCHMPTQAGSVSGIRVYFLVGTTVYEYQKQGDDPYRFCAETTTARDTVLLTVDPVAAELVGLAQQAIATQFDLPVRRVQWLSVEPFRWWDTSLGCVLPGQQYTPVDVPGYRIVVQAGDNQYAFHSDSERLFPCAAGNEVLTAPPTPAPEPTTAVTPEG